MCKMNGKLGLDMDVLEVLQNLQTIKNRVLNVMQNNFHSNQTLLRDTKLS